MDYRLIDDSEGDLRNARNLIARTLLGADSAVDPRLGKLTLRPHQVSAVGRLVDIIAGHRGALLADAVGLGKTYVALAVARVYGRTLVVCPATLRGMWNAAMATAELTACIVSTEALSRGAVFPDDFHLVIVDEAHHFRTMATRRYEAIARLARRSRVLLLSATPLHNSRRDLTSVLALFAGSGIHHWSDDALARLIVRRDDRLADQALPALSGPHALVSGGDDDFVETILGLPPAVPAADEGVAHALVTISLVQLWSSSRAAVLASVRKRLARATALRDAVAAGHMPTSSELAAWRYADDALQMAFPLFTPSEESIDQQSLGAKLEQFVDAARGLIDRARQSPDPDETRAQLLRALRRRHTGERIVAFSQYANTVSALGRLMRGDPGIAIVTASSARIASGSIAREEVLEQFAVKAARVNPVERIDLLLTTDLLSEGIDLRGASVIVHLDLPWNPARMEQRVGRSRRLGSPFDSIHVYTFLPPIAAERMTEIRRRLADKVIMARAIVGGDFDPLGRAATVGSPVGAGEALRARIRDWLTAGRGNIHEDPATAAVECGTRGWMAAVIIRGAGRLIGDLGDGIVEDATTLTGVIDRMERPVSVTPDRLASALTAIQRWIAARDATVEIDIRSSAKRAVLDRLAQTVARAPRHRRPALISAARNTRSALAGVSGVGTERMLATLAQSPADDEAWLQSLAALSLSPDDHNRRQSRDGIIAIILLEPISAGDATPG